MPAVSARCLANRVMSSSVWGRQYAGAEQIYYSSGSEYDHTGEGTCPTHYDRNRILQCVVAGIGAAPRCFPYVLSWAIRRHRGLRNPAIRPRPVVRGRSPSDLIGGDTSAR